MVLSTIKGQSKKTTNLSETEDSSIQKSQEQIEDFSQYFRVEIVIESATHSELLVNPSGRAPLATTSFTFTTTE